MAYSKSVRKPYVKRKKPMAKRKPTPYNNRSMINKAYSIMKYNSRMIRQSYNNAVMRRVGQNQLLSSGPEVYIPTGLTALASYQQAFGVDRGTTNNIDGSKVLIRGFKVDAKIESHQVEDLVNVGFHIIKPAKLNTGWQLTMTSGDEYITLNSGKIQFNSKQVNDYKSHYKDIGHFEALSTTPATNTNNPVYDTQARFSYYHRFKKPIVIDKGDITNVFNMSALAIPSPKRYLFAITHNNTSGTNSLRLNWDCLVYCSFLA